MGAIPLGGFVAPELAVNFASISLQKTPILNLIMVTIKRRSVHDREAIGPRSWLFSCLLRLESCAEIVALNPGRKIHDRGSITPRSRFDRTAIVDFFREWS